MMSVLQVRVGFDLGLYSSEEVGVWVDAKLAATASPSKILLELTTIARRSKDEIVRLLARLDGQRASAECTHMELAVLSALYRARRLNLREAISRMSTCALNGDGLTQLQIDTIFQIDDELCLAEEGTHVTVAQARRDFEAFIATLPDLSFTVYEA
jgi:hypothetical protein